MKNGKGLIAKLFLVFTIGLFSIPSFAGMIYTTPGEAQLFTRPVPGDVNSGRIQVCTKNADRTKCTNYPKNLNPGLDFRNEFHNWNYFLKRCEAFTLHNASVDILHTFLILGAGVAVTALTTSSAAGGAVAGGLFLLTEMSPARYPHYEPPIYPSDIDKEGKIIKTGIERTADFLQFILDGNGEKTRKKLPTRYLVAFYKIMENCSQANFDADFIQYSKNHCKQSCHGIEQPEELSVNSLNTQKTHMELYRPSFLNPTSGR